MGLSSSQARLLSLTGRMHDIEYKAQHLEAQKLQMANESAHVYKEYENALNATKIQVKQMSADGSSNFIDATYQNLLDSDYFIEFSSTNEIWGKNGKYTEGKTNITQQDKINYDNSQSNIDLFVALEKGIAGATLSTANNAKGYKEIYTADQLKQAAGNGNYILMADIDMSSINWTPQDFSGKLDGNGHTIKGLKNSLFKNLTGATIENISLSDVNINNTSDKNQLGALAKKSSGGTNISNVSVSGTVVDSTGTNSVGGLIGEASNTEIKNVSANVNITSNGYRIGGIIGGGVGGNVAISNSSFSGNIIGQNNSTKSHSGGIVGEDWSGNLTIDNCSSTGSISSNSTTNASAGGIIGLPDTTYKITNSVFSGTTSKNGTLANNNILGTDVSILGTGTTSSIGTRIATNDIADGGSNPTYRELFNIIKDGNYVIDGSESPARGYLDDGEWFTNMVNNGFIFLYKKDSDNKLFQVNIATDTSLQEVSDSLELKKAEAKYEADMRKIDAKDKKFDTDLAAMEQERNAIKTEMETLKTVAKDNVDRTFRLFS